MATDIFLPQLGLTMTDGTVVRWLKQEGEPVEKDEPVVEIETDKVTMEVEATVAGIMGPILVDEGSVVGIGAVLGYVLEPGEEPPVLATTAAEAALSPPASRVAVAEQTRQLELTPQRDGRKLIASPRSRRLAYELGIDLVQVEASGPGGRIVEADVRWYADQAAATSLRVSPLARRMAEAMDVDLNEIEGSGQGGRVVKKDVERTVTPKAESAPIPTSAVEQDQIEPLTGIRRVVAERMTHSFTTTPHFYLSVEVEATALTRMRERLLSKVEGATGVRLTLTDILLKICAQALTEFPKVNVAWVESRSNQDAGGVLRRQQVNIGIAVAIDDGLVVPIIHQADQLGLGEIAQRRVDLVKRARVGKLTLPDLEGGTFTLSNLGMFGIDQFHAIINSPQSAILAVGRIRERPVAIDGQLAVRPTMYLTLSVDHRPLDGAEAARFLERVACLIEEPYLLLS